MKVVVVEKRSSRSFPYLPSCPAGRPAGLFLVRQAAGRINPLSPHTYGDRTGKEKKLYAGENRDPALRVF